MTEAKHTPWRFEHHDRNFIVRESHRGSAIAFIYYAGDSTQANARLIAAAPDLLEACRHALISLRAWNTMGLSGAIAKELAEAYEHSPEVKSLVAAIAKTEGGAVQHESDGDNK